MNMLLDLGETWFCELWVSAGNTFPPSGVRW